MVDRNKAWVELLKSSNTAPIIPKSNKYQSEFFEHKFNASFLKLLQLKGCHFEKDGVQSSVLFSPELNQFHSNFIYRPFSFGPHKEIGWVVLGPEMMAELLHHFLGGSPKVAPMPLQKEPTKVERKTLQNVNGPLALSLREGLKGLLGIHDCEIGDDWDELGLNNQLSKGGSYFRETLTYKGSTQLRIDVFFRVEAFNPAQK
jgi:hypothetical protein